MSTPTCVVGRHRSSGYNIDTRPDQSLDHAALHFEPRTAQRTALVVIGHQPARHCFPPGQIMLRPREVVEILKSDYGTQWWMVRCSDGREGVDLGSA